MLGCGILLWVVIIGDWWSFSFSLGLSALLEQIWLTRISGIFVEEWREKASNVIDKNFEGSRIRVLVNLS